MSVAEVRKAPRGGPARGRQGGSGRRDAVNRGVKAKKRYQNNNQRE